MRKWLICGLVALVPVVMRAAEPEALPSSEQMHKTFTEGQYQQVLQQLSRVLPLKGPAARPYDRVDLLTLRGETFLQMKQQSKALDSFKEALKEAQTGGGVDPKQPRDPKVTEEQTRGLRAEMLLINRSQAFAYKPKVAPVGTVPAPISVLDVTQRKPAYTALLADVKVEMAPKVKAAKAGKSLVPVIEIVRTLGDLRAVEQSATGATTESDALLDDLSGHAAELMGDEVARVEKQTTKISDSANTSILLRDNIGGTVRSGSGGQTVDRYKLTGLTYQDNQNLKAAIDTTAKIAGVAHDFGETGAKSATAFKKIEKDATATHDKANDVLKADYNQIYDSPPKKPK